MLTQGQYLDHQDFTVQGLASLPAELKARIRLGDPNLYCVDPETDHDTLLITERVPHPDPELLVLRWIATMHNHEADPIQLTDHSLPCVELHIIDTLLDLPPEFAQLVVGDAYDTQVEE